jgi:hypothetical protein
MQKGESGNARFGRRRCEYAKTNRSDALSEMHCATDTVIRREHSCAWHRPLLEVFRSSGKRGSSAVNLATIASTSSASCTSTRSQPTHCAGRPASAVSRLSSRKMSGPRGPSSTKTMVSSAVSALIPRSDSCSTRISGAVRSLSSSYMSYSQSERARMPLQLGSQNRMDEKARPLATFGQNSNVRSTHAHT